MKALIIVLNILFMICCVQAYADTTPSVSKPSSKTSVRIDLNTASEQVLREAFKGIGKRRAAAIIAYRTEHGAFTSVAELANVKSMGKPFVSRHLSELEKAFCVKSK